MQVESNDEIVLAYAHQIMWLKERLKKLEQGGINVETDPVYAKVARELNGCQNAHDRIKETLAVPKGRWVLVLRSKVSGLQGKVGLVTYVNVDHNFATVSFDAGSHLHNLGMGNLQVINLPVPTMKIPAVGMKVQFKDDGSEYMALKWTSDKVYVESLPRASFGTNNLFWKSRHDVATIDGVPPV